MPKESLTDKAYRRIKAWIIDFQLKPGSHLSVQDLAEALGISRTPVREALSRLEQEYLVVRAPMKGFAVKAVDLDEIADLFQVRTVIELLAVRQAAQRMTPETRRELAKSLKSTITWIEKGEKTRSLQLEQNFHMKILESSGNIPLVEIGRGILERIWAIQRFNIITSDVLVEAHSQHDEIYRALAEGNVRQAEEAMRRHMRHTTRDLITRLRDQNDIIHNAIAFDPKKSGRIK
jgi:DNA-binding GntR family transcriptional regulator